MTREQRKPASDKISEKFLSRTILSSRTKNKFDAPYMLNYYHDFSRLIVDNEGAAMPFVREDGDVVFSDDLKPTLDEELIDRQENSAQGSKAYWNKLISFDEICKSVTTTTDKTTEEQMSRMQEMHERRKDFAKYQRERYSAQRDAQKRRKYTKEEQGMESDLFKNEVLHTSLVTAQKRHPFSCFHEGFLCHGNWTVFAPINLPQVPAVSKECSEPLPDEPSESVVTGNRRVVTTMWCDMKKSWRNKTLSLWSELHSA